MGNGVVHTCVRWVTVVCTLVCREAEDIQQMNLVCHKMQEVYALPATAHPQQQVCPKPSPRHRPPAAAGVPETLSPRPPTRSSTFAFDASLSVPLD